MPVDESQITPEVLANILAREVYDEVRVVAPPKMGKVRTVYDIGFAELLMMSSDNLSTHDVVHRRQVFAKGDNLDAISAYYFDATKGIVPNHLKSRLAPNTWLVQKADPILVEMVFRQYLTGSGWKAYEKENGPEQGMTFCGVPLRPGYRKNERLDELVFTPTAKGQVKDFPIPEFQGMDPEEDDPKLTVEMIRRNYQIFGLKSPEDLDKVVDIATRLYRFIHDDLQSKGHLLADTKWELGYLPDRRIALIDECVTPDSSRFWSTAHYAFNPETNEFTIVQDDKQHFRDHIERLGLHKDKKALAEYWMPDDVLTQGVVKYCNIREAITGTLPEITTAPRKKMILDILADIHLLK